MDSTWAGLELQESSCIGRREEAVAGKEEAGASKELGPGRRIDKVNTMWREGKAKSIFLKCAAYNCVSKWTFLKGATAPGEGEGRGERQGEVQ